MKTFLVILCGFLVACSSSPKPPQRAAAAMPAKKKPVKKVVAPQAFTSLALAWDQSNDAAGYRIRYGLQSGVYPGAIDAGAATEIVVPNLVRGEKYYFAAFSYNADGIESLSSNEVSTPLLLVDGVINLCGKSVESNVTATLTGDQSGTTQTDNLGVFAFLLPRGGAYSIALSKPRATFADHRINSIDVIAIQSYFLDPIAHPLACPIAGDCNLDGRVNSVDALAAQYFFTARQVASSHCGEYIFSPSVISLPDLRAEQSVGVQGILIGDVQ